MSKLKRNILSVALFVLAAFAVLFGFAFMNGNHGTTTVTASAATNTTATVQTVQGSATYQLFNSGRTGNGYKYSGSYNSNEKSLTNNGYDLYATASGHPRIQLGLPFQVNYAVTEKATLTIYAYDVDESSGERDLIYLVDENTGIETQLPGYLHGMDGRWNTTTMDIDPSYFTVGHKYHFKLYESVSGWVVYVRTVSLQINAADSKVTGDLTASINASGVVNTTLELRSETTATYSLEYAANYNYNQYGMATASVTATPAGVTKTVSFNLTAGAPKTVTYDIDVIVKDSNGNNVASFSAKASPSSYAVDYKSNGGSNNLPEDTNAYFSGNTVTVLFNYVPSREGYDFLGWSTDRNATTPMYTKNGTKTFTITGNVTLYAVWKSNVHEHEAGDWITLQEATCTAQGIQIKKCECGEEVARRSTDALGHNYTYSHTVNATCTATGYDVYKCTRCGDTKNENYVVELGHNYVYNRTVASTCTARGYEIHVCTLCDDAVNKNYTDILPHNYVLQDREYPDCTKEGYATYQCADCPAGYTQILPIAEHNWANDVVYSPATCENDGYFQVHCLVCGKDEIIVDKGTAFGHDLDDGVYVVVPECYKDGIMRYTCQNDGCEYYKDVYIPQEHDFKVVYVQDATCDKDGMAYYTCILCGVDQTKTIAAYGHEYAYTDNGNGTHTAVCARCPDQKVEAHYGDRRVCVCGYRNGAFIEVLLIQDNQPWTTNSNENVLSRLKKNGYIDAWTKCSTTDVLNGKVVLANYSMVIFANDQTNATYNNYAKFASELEAYVQGGGALLFGACDGGWRGGDLTARLPGGAKNVWKLDYNNTIADVNNAIVTGENTDGKALVNSDLSSTYCSHVYFENIPVNANVIFRNTNGQATLIEYALGDGYVIASGLTWEYSVVYCSYADFADIAYDDMIVTALGKVNAYAQDVWVAKFVDEDGTLLATQRVVKGLAPMMPEMPSKEGYTFVGWTLDGKDICTETLPVIESDVTFTAVFSVGACKHANVRVEGYVEGNCSTMGYSGDVYCNDCGAFVEAGYEFENVEHKYEYYKTVDPTCTLNGCDYYKCEECNELKMENITAAFGHTEVAVEGYEMTCQEDGLTDGIFCEECGEWIVEQEVIVAHPDEVNIIEAREATCTEDGCTYGEYCNHCGKWLVVSDEIPSGHVESGWLKTKNDEGVVIGEYKECKRCGEQLETRDVEVAEPENIEVGVAGCSGVIGMTSILPCAAFVGGMMLIRRRKNREDGVSSEE